MPLISGYCTLNLTDSTKRKDEMDKALAWAKLIKKYNGRIFVLGPNQVKRAEYDFAANKANIVSTLNEAAKAGHRPGPDGGAAPAHRYLRRIAR